MGERTRRILVATVLAILLSGGAVVARAATGAPGPATTPSGATLARCARAALGLSPGRARAVDGSADPQLSASHAVLRRTRAPADALPQVTGLRLALAEAGAVTYDPTASIRLRRMGAHGGVYLVPAAISSAGFATACAGLAQTPALQDLRDATVGTGPGLCSITIDREVTRTATVPLPGQAAPRPELVVEAGSAGCESSTVLSGYAGLVNSLTGDAGTPGYVVPDGVTSVLYTLASGHTVLARVHDGLAEPTARDFGQVDPGGAGTQFTIGALRRALDTALPVTITERGPGGAVLSTFPRPATLITDVLGTFRLVKAISGPGTSTSPRTGTSTAQSIELAGASCRAASHRCVAVTVQMSCGTTATCHTTRTIHRYRYVGRRPPAGTTGPDDLPTGPVVGHLDLHVTHPGRLLLDLTGAGHRRVPVIEMVSCTSGPTVSEVPIAVKQLGVPSRSVIEVPASVGSRASCEIGVIVTASRPGRVGVAVTRG